MSVPDSRSLLSAGDLADQPRQGAAHGTLAGVLSQMRDQRGGPNLGLKLLALLVALLLAGPLTVFLLQALSKVVQLAI
jgi:hypothetical protein